MAGESLGAKTPACGQIGSEIRQLRKAKGLTLHDLASATGRSIGYVSQMERGLSTLSIEDLRRLAEALEVPLSWFFAHEDVPEEERGRVVRAANRRTLGGVEGGLTEELLSPDLGDPFEVILSTFEPGAGPSASQRRPTQEVGYLVSGRLRLWIGKACFDLAAGDSFRLKGESFRWHNPGAERATVVWVIAPPIY
ncbi:MAG TPA: XRE family transcriptional regulator [Kiloniellales bacterium]|nr:XRE family transcriptional regulator [Kiloniellales bacterium]